MSVAVRLRITKKVSGRLWRSGNPFFAGVNRSALQFPLPPGEGIREQKRLCDITGGRCGMEVVREERKIETEVGTERRRQNSREMDLFCPLCNVFAGRRIRNKLYCGNCGFVES